MIITDIKQGKKEKDRAHLYSDGKYIGTVYIDFLVKYHINVDSDISKETLSQILSESNNKKLFSLCINYILRRMRSEKEIREYIDKKIFKYKWNKEDVNKDEILEKLNNYNYVDDAKFAIAWVDSRLHKGHGPQKLKMELIQKGISKEIIEDVLNNINDKSKDDEIKKLTEKYLRNKSFKNDAEKKWKLKQYLMSRGF